MVMSVDNLGSEFHRGPCHKELSYVKGGETDNGIWALLGCRGSRRVGGGRSSDSRRSRWRSQLYEHPRRRSTSAFDVQTVGSIGFGAHYVVSYLVKDRRLVSGFTTPLGTARPHRD